MKEKLPATSLVTTRRRLPVLETIAQEVEGTYRTKTVTSEWDGKEHIVFTFRGDVSRLRVRILVHDLKERKARNTTK